MIETLFLLIRSNKQPKKIKNIDYEQDIINMYSIDGTNIILENNNKLKYNILGCHEWN